MARVASSSSDLERSRNVDMVINGVNADTLAQRFIPE